MAEHTDNVFELWARIVDEDGERFEKIHKLTDEEIELYEAPEDETDEATEDEIKALCGKTLREKYFLEGMVAAYEKVLCIYGVYDEDDE